MKKLFISVFVIVTSTFTYAQNNKLLDSLIKVYQTQKVSIEKVKIAENIFTKSRKSNPKLALEYLHKGLRLSQNLKHSDGIAKSYKNLGFYYVNYFNLDSLRFYFSKAEKAYQENNKELFSILHRWGRAENLEGNFEKALKISDKSIEVVKEHQNGLMLSNAFQQQSTIYLDKGDYKNALELLIKASKVLDTVKAEHSLNKAIIKVGIGRTETLRNNLNEAIPYLKEGISILEDLNHSKWLAISYMELGNTYYDLTQYKAALLNYNKGLKISKEKKWDNFIAPYLANIGAIYLDTKDFDKALKYFFDSNKISNKHGSINNKIIFYNDVASAYLGKKDYEKSLAHYSKAIKLADSIGSLDNLSDNYKERAKAYEESGNHKKALIDLKKHLILNDSLFNINKAKQIENLKIQYETDKKEQEIEILKQEEKNNNLQRLLLAIGLLLTLIIIYAISQKLKRNKIEKEKADALLAFKKKELTTQALHLAKKNALLDDLKQKAKTFKSSEDNQNGYQQLIRTINFDLKSDSNWDNFSKSFQEVHKDFNANIKQKFPDVTANELRLMSLLKMNLSSKEIANILNISPDGVKKARYRLRKKLNITTEESLEDLVINL